MQEAAELEDIYKPLAERTPDTQYRDRLEFILKYGIRIGNTNQGIDAFTCFGTLPQMVFDLRQGVPLITERKLLSWKSAVCEIIAFINGARSIDDIESYGVNPAFWSPYRGKGFGPDRNDMGPASYGPAFHDFPSPEGPFNQFKQLVENIRHYPNVRTLMVNPWVPYWAGPDKNRKVIVSPCHGWLHFRVIDEKLCMRMDQRSADMPIGVPHNMIQYAALLLMICQVTGHQPGYYVHSLSDAHIYENQLEKIEELIQRASRPFPKLYLDREVDNLFDFRIEHFSLEEYDPHPSMAIPYSP